MLAKRSLTIEAVSTQNGARRLGLLIYLNELKFERAAELQI